MKSFALCYGAGLKICADCERHVDRHPVAAKSRHQPFVGATTNDKCGLWKAPRTTVPRATPINQQDEE